MIATEEIFGGNMKRNVIVLANLDAEKAERCDVAAFDFEVNKSDKVIIFMAKDAPVPSKEVVSNTILRFSKLLGVPTESILMLRGMIAMSVIKGAFVEGKFDQTKTDAPEPEKCTPATTREAPQ